MNGKNSIATVLPAGEANTNIFVIVAALIIIPCLLTIVYPPLPKLLFLIIPVLICMYAFRFHILQLILFSVLVPMIFISIPQGINSISIGMQVMLALIWIIALNIFGHGNLKSDRDLIFLWALHFFFAVNVIFSTMYNASFSLFTVSETFRYGLYAGLLFVSYHFFKNLAVLKRIIYTIILIAVPIAAYTYYYALAIGFKSITDFGLVVMHGISIGQANANTVSNAITDPLVILLSFIMFGAGKKKKHICIALFIFFIFAWIALNSRSSYVLFIVAFLTLIMFHRKRWNFILISAAVFLLIFAIIQIGVFPKLNLFLRLQRGLTYRDDLWLAAFRMISESPLLGKGPGFFSPNKFMYMNPGIGRIATGLFELSPHNVILERGVDFGIFAMIVQIIIWFYSVGVFIRNAFKLKQSEYYYIYLASGAIWIGLIFRGVFGTGGNIASIIYLAVILAMPQAVKSADPVKS